MKNYIKANSIQDYFGAIFLIVVFFVGVVFFFIFSQKTANPEPEKILVKQPECLGTLEEYNELVSKGQSVVLALNQSSYAVNGKFVGMKEEIPKCRDCGQPMFLIAELTGDIQEMDFDFNVIGIRHPKLYQCPEDKTIVVY